MLFRLPVSIECNMRVPLCVFELCVRMLAPGTRMCLASAMASAQIQSPAHPSPFTPRFRCARLLPLVAPAPCAHPRSSIVFSLSLLQLLEHNEIAPKHKSFHHVASFARHFFQALVTIACGTRAARRPPLCPPVLCSSTRAGSTGQLWRACACWRQRREEEEEGGAVGCAVELRGRGLHEFPVFFAGS